MSSMSPMRWCSSLAKAWQLRALFHSLTSWHSDGANGLRIGWPNRPWAAPAHTHGSRFLNGANELGLESMPNWTSCSWKHMKAWKWMKVIGSTTDCPSHAVYKVNSVLNTGTRWNWNQRGVSSGGSKTEGWRTESPNVWFSETAFTLWRAEKRACSLKTDILISFDFYI